MLQPIRANLEESDDTSVDVGFLTLPRELRNKIYEELLCVDEFQVLHFGWLRTLEPKILGVSRQIYHEASEILYDKNGWVTITTVDWIIHSLATDYIRHVQGFPGQNQPVTRYEDDRLSKSAILDIKLQPHSSMEVTNLVIPLSGMPRFCRLLTQFDSVNTLDLVLRFNHRAKENHQSRLLGYLGQARGLGSVVITDTEPSWAAANTILLMTHPYKRSEEALNIVSAYKNSSKHESKLGHTLAARNLAQDGVDFIDWWMYEIRNRMAAELELNDSKELESLAQARADMGFSCASLSLRLGSTDLARRAIERVLKRLSLNQQICDTHRACAHYYMAQTFEAKGWKNAALYSYLQALRLKPGYQDAGVAVDQMQKHLGSCTALEDATVKHNIDNVVNPFRNQPARSFAESQRYYREVFQEFAGTSAEIRSLDRRASGDVSDPYNETSDVVSDHAQNDLVYMDPYYRPPGYYDGDDVNLG